MFISLSKSYEAGFDKWISLAGKRPDQFDPLFNKLTVQYRVIAQLISDRRIHGLWRPRWRIGRGFVLHREPRDQAGA
jgi:hypothetical protein